MYYFACGVNLNKAQMRKRCSDSNPLFTAVLPNYKLVFVGWSREWRAGIASIKSFRGERVRGAIYEISESCLKQLDKYKGYPGNYTRLKVTVFSEDDEPIEAITYLKAGQFEETKPSQEYLAVIQQGLQDWRLF